MSSQVMGSWQHFHPCCLEELSAACSVKLQGRQGGYWIHVCTTTIQGWELLGVGVQASVLNSNFNAIYIGKEE